MEAQASFSFDDKNRDGRLNEGELAWARLYATSETVALGVDEIRKELYESLGRPPSRLFRSGPIRGNRVEGGYELRAGGQTEAEEKPTTLHVSEDYLIQSMESEAERGRMSATLTFRNVGDRVILAGISAQAIGTEGGEGTVEYAYYYTELDGTMIPEMFSKTQTRTEGGSGIYTEIQSTISFHDWQLEKRPQALPKFKASPTPKPVQPPARPQVLRLQGRRGEERPRRRAEPGPGTRAGRRKARGSRPAAARGARPGRRKSSRGGGCHVRGSRNRRRAGSRDAREAGG
jgi:hypothetical protein